MRSLYTSKFSSYIGLKTVNCLPSLSIMDSGNGFLGEISMIMAVLKMYCLVNKLDFDFYNGVPSSYIISMSLVDK